jgi:hypothetical protein
VRKATAGIILALLVAASLGIGYLAVNSGGQAATSTSTSSQQTPISTSVVGNPTTSATAASTTSSSGLELRIGLNATTIEPGKTLGANVTLFNTLDQNLSLLPHYPADFNKSTIQSWDNHDFPCGESGSPSYLASFALLFGHFSVVNISRSLPLQVAAWPAQLLCNGPVLPDMVVFLPNSSFAFMYSGTNLEDKTSITLHPTTESCNALPVGSSQCHKGTESCLPSGSPQCHKGTGLFGYWSLTTNSTCCPAPTATNSLYFRYFTPGEYTLAAEDIWNDTVFAYFRVAQGPSPSLAVSAQESPFSNPRAPVIGITLANFGDVSITSLGAVLQFVPPPNSPASSTSYQFAFVVNPTEPLLPGQTVQDVRTLQGDLFDIGVNYPLTISGTLANGTAFTYTQQVQFVNSVPSW